ncbi:hypothetical protein ACVCFZ_05085 [Acinetobacter variabilis]|uniref:hypothetical protein n=1 Tax=Acinetobacter variabilis TaxID=70346 RepID=UPI00289B1138|nr:hypothetical protein [Acinetobacter variabilis]
MRPPIPKTKVDEIKEILNNANHDSLLSEFKYARCIRILADIQPFSSEDQVNMFRSIVELYAGNLLKAKKIALKNYEISNDLQVLRNAVFVFQNTMALDWVVRTMGKIANISRKLNIDFKESLPESYELSYFLSGNLDLAHSYYESMEINTLLRDLEMIQKTLDISNESLKSILQVVHKVFINSKYRYNFLEYSYIEEEFLLTIYLFNSHEEVWQLNMEIADQCYQAGLLDELNKISYFFLPSEGNQA